METIRSEARRGAVSAVYGRLPANFLTDERLLTADWSIDVSFRGHAKAVLRRPGPRTHEKSIAPGTCTIYASGATEFVELTQPSEYVEFVIPPDLRRAVSKELKTGYDPQLADIDGIADPVVWAAGTRVRSAALSDENLHSLELDELAYRVLSSLMLRVFGGTRPRTNSLGLDSDRVTRLAEYIEANIRDSIRLDDLAHVVCLSKWQFMRSFKATFGITPHRFVSARRMERARSVLFMTGATVDHAAKAIGMSDNHSFRAAFVREFGMLPAAARSDWK